MDRVISMTAPCEIGVTAGSHRACAKSLLAGTTVVGAVTGHVSATRDLQQDFGHFPRLREHQIMAGIDFVVAMAG